jgi:hypothetical protein
MSASGAFMPTRTFCAPHTIELFRVRMPSNRLHLADDDIRQRRRRRLNRLDFEPDHRQRMCQPAHVGARVGPLPQPLQADLHQENCRRKRRSFSKNKRRSLTS